jgi:hypothetical protein
MATSTSSENTSTTTTTDSEDYDRYGWLEGTDVSESTGGEAGPLQQGINYSTYMRKNTKNYDSFKYFLEGIDATDQNLDQMTPFRPGIARLYFHKTPYFMAKGFAKLTENFRSYIETGFKSVSGLGDLSSTDMTIEGGWANQKMNSMGLVTDETNEIEITLYEQTGSPVRSFIETWMTGIRDPRSGVAHYHGYVKGPTNSDGSSVSGSGDDNIEPITYCEKNHTGEFIYVVLDPTAQYIEYACLLAHVWPKSSPRSHLNYASGQVDPAELTLRFDCVKYESKYINDIAAYYIEKSNLLYNYLDFNPYRDMSDPHAALSTIQSNNTSNNKFAEYMGRTGNHAGTETLGSSSLSTASV